ncbi:MAG: right-handed parallel beta-helix repeat-containing protein, partial [Clostridia bacterium]|nr:right-handed parallel beta-helix repeat-containing protein [Clostridia bacterium]
GYVKTGKVIDFGWSVDYPDRAPKGAPNTFEFKDNRIKKWTQAEPGTILLDGYWKFDWSEQTLPIAEIDTVNMTITTTHGATFSLEEGKRFFAYNLIEELTAPGEYYLDYKNCILYLIPPTDITKARITMSAMQETLMQFKGASYINVRGLDFTGSRVSAIEFDDKCSNCEISDSEISYTAKHAVYTRGYNNGIRDSYIHDVDGGINLDGGDVPTLTDGNCYIINCEIEKFSRLTSTYMPAIHLAGVGNIAMHNEIHDGPHMAIQIGSQFAKVYYNDIYNVLNGGNDAGAIYGYMNWTFIGNEFKYNRIHDCANPNARGSTVDGGGIVGFYMDGGLSWNVIVGNIIYDFAGTAYALNGGRDNIMVNNIADNCTLAFETTAVMSGGVNNDSRKNAHLQGKDYLYSEKWKERYPKFNAWLYEADTERCKPVNNVTRNNLFLNGTFTIQRAQAVIDLFYDMSENYIGNEDPGFVNWVNRDYNMELDAGIYEKLPDFKPLPFTRMGRLNELAEARIDDAVVLAIDSGDAFVEGSKVTIDEDPAIVPFAESGTTYIPLRFLAESLGAGVDWKDGKVYISSDTVNLEMVPGSLEATKNGEKITLNNASRVVNQRTMVPLREISELLDKEVMWHAPGFISVSDDPELFLENDTTDVTMMDYIYGRLNKH